jgi:hypothetical protein
MAAIPGNGITLVKRKSRPGRREAVPRQRRTQNNRSRARSARNPAAAAAAQIGGYLSTGVHQQQ